MANALQDVVVLDLTEDVAGPYCTRLLAGLGAEVIKIEARGEGDPCRKLLPLGNDRNPLERGALYQHLNSGKKSLSLNLDSVRGQKILEDLTQQAHMIVESLAPGTLQRWGLDYATLANENPALVLVSISGFGQDGPYRDYASTNLIELAMGGMLYTCGEPDREPLQIGGFQAGYLAGLGAASAALAAFYQAEVSGIGEHVDVSVMESVAFALEATTVKYTRDGIIRGRQGNRHGTSYPMTLLPCRDGYAGVMLTSDDDWALFAEFVGEPALMDSRFARGEDRFRRADEIKVLLRPFLAEHTRGGLFDWAQERRIPFAMVLTPHELLHDPHHRARQFLTPVEHPVLGELTVVGAPFQMTASPWKIERAPLVGEHTTIILRERLGLSDGEIWELVQAGTL